MTSPYTSVSITGFNSNPPPNDASETAANLADWDLQVVGKVGTPLKTAIEQIDSNITTAFGKVFGGSPAVATATGLIIQSSNQSNVIYYTGSGSHTHTTPDATTVGTPFQVYFANIGTTDTTIDGSGSQTVNGSATVTVRPGQSGMLFTDGANWFMTGLLPVPVKRDIGELWMWGGTVASIPAMNIACQGQSLATADFPDLFAALGYTHGGSGANFNLPNVDGRSIVFEGQGATTAEGDTTGTDRVQGADGGYETHSLTEAQNGQHNHNIGGVYNAGSGGASVRDASASGGSTGNSGSGDPHNNMHPWYCTGPLVVYTNQTDHDYLGVIT